MRASVLPIRLLVGAILTAWSCAALAADAPAKPAAAKPGPTDAQLIASAESAAPPSVGKHATIVAMEEGGKMRTVRKGTNNFACMPDNPAPPGPAPLRLGQDDLAPHPAAPHPHTPPPTAPKSVRPPAVDAATRYHTH